MKTWMKMLIAMAVMAMMAACHPDLNEKNNNQGPSGPDNSIFLSLNVALPPAGPAAKADGDVGHEAGTEAESKVSTMLVVLADKDNNNYITHGIMVNPTLSGAAGNQSVTGVASMDRGGLSQYYASNNENGQLKDGKEIINVFVFCNYTQALLQAVTQSSHADASWIHAAGEVTKILDESIWKDNYFLMSNESIAERELPKTLTDWNSYGEESTPFSLCGTNGGGINNGGTGRGPITVQRVMARIDLKDGSGSETDAWTYPIHTTGSGNGDLQVKIERVSLVNQSMHYYFLKHVVKDGITGASEIAKPENSTVCGQEKGTDLTFSYVVDADAAADYKQKSGADDVIATNATSQNFLYPLFNSSGAIDNSVRQRWDAISTEGFGDSYKAWTYTTENTTPHNNNRAGITTGVVFKGRLVPTEGVNQTLKDAANGDYKIPTGHDQNEYYLTELKVGNETKIYPLLYAFGETNRKIYAGWNDQVKTEVDALAGTGTPTPEQIEAMPDGRIDKAYWAPCYTPEDGTDEVSPKEMFDRLLEVQQNSPNDVQAIEKAREAFKAAAVKAGFTVYQASFATEDFNDGEIGLAGGDAGYFCYYFYWIRHNLAESVGDMYPMEYAVVRNNVYKLSIKSIRRFGHPRFSAHDVDPVTVNTPCEKSEIYMSVEVKVADWVTRESEIIL